MTGSPPTFRRNDVRPLTSGPRKLKLNRRYCSGVFFVANAFLAFSTSLRRPTFALPLHWVTLGLVMIWICTRPALWLSAANELTRNRIWRISSRGGSAPP